VSNIMVMLCINAALNKHEYLQSVRFVMSNSFYAFVSDSSPKAFCLWAVCVCPWLYSKILRKEYLTNCLCEFHQIFHLCAVWDKGKLTRFWGQKVMFMARPNIVKKHLGNVELYAFECHGHRQPFQQRHRGPSSFYLVNSLLR